MYVEKEKFWLSDCNTLC